MDKRLSIIIAWHNRDELEQTLRDNSPAFQKCCSEVLIVNAGGDSQRLKRLLCNADFNVRQIYIPGATFNRSLCLNIGAFRSSFDSNLLFFLDADIILEQAILSDCLSSIVESSFLVISRVDEYDSLQEAKPKENRLFLRELTQTSELVCADGRTARIDNQTWFDGGYTGTGLIIVPKNAFIKINGANTYMTGWGFEDIDIQIRLQLALNMKKINRGRVVHLTHSDKLRDLGDDTHNADLSYKKEMLRRKNEMLAYANYNKGDFLGTYYNDAAKWRDLLVEN